MSNYNNLLERPLTSASNRPLTDSNEVTFDRKRMYGNIDLLYVTRYFLYKYFLDYTP